MGTSRERLVPIRPAVWKFFFVFSPPVLVAKASAGSEVHVDVVSPLMLLLAAAASWWRVRVPGACPARAGSKQEATERLWVAAGDSAASFC